MYTFVSLGLAKSNIGRRWQRDTGEDTLLVVECQSSVSVVSGKFYGAVNVSVVCGELTVRLKTGDIPKCNS